VREYVQYDPTGDYLIPPLKGFRLVGENYEPMLTTSMPDGTHVLHSEVLGLDLRLEHGVLHFFDPMTGQCLLTYGEVQAARQQAEERARQEAAVRAAAEAHIAELEARLRALQQEP